MTERIQTRVFNYGNEKESSWPPKYGTASILGDDEGGGVYHIGEDGKLVNGYPPPKNRVFARAPYIITDTIDAHYHHGACQWTESKSGLRQMDDATGTITTGSRLQPNLAPIKRRAAERRKDLHESMHRAVAQLDAGTAPLTEEQRQLCERQNEIVSEALNFDAFNVAGRKKNAKGKKYRR